MTQEELRQLIIDTVYTNTEGEIEGNPLQDVLLEMVGGSGAFNTVSGQTAYATSGVSIFGTGQITLTNGANTIVGDGLLDTSPIGFSGLSYVYIVNNATQARYKLLWDVVADDNNATIFAVYDVYDENDAGTDYAPGGIWGGATGAYSAYACIPGVVSDVNTGENISIGSGSITANGAAFTQIGMRNVATNAGAGIQIGSKNIGTQDIIQIGLLNKVQTVESSQSIIIGQQNTQDAPDSSQLSRQTIIGTSNNIKGARSIILGHDCTISSTSAQNAIISCLNTEITAGTGASTNNVVCIGLKNETINENNFADTVVLYKIMALNLPTYADEAAAILGGLQTNMIYKTATGELRIKL